MKSPKPESLTPAARLSAELAAGVTPEQILLALTQALSADTVARDGSRQPDHRARIDSAKLLLAYALGLPLQRTESVSVSLDADSSVGLKERLASSPAMRSALLKLLNDSGPAVDV